MPQGISAELIAEKWSIPRDELDALAYESHHRALTATEEGRFEAEVLPIESADDGGIVEVMNRDEGIRADTSPEKLAGLNPAFKPDGVVTAGNSSQISDGAAAVLIMSEDKAEELGLTPKARFVGFAIAGVDPVMMLTGPIPATQKVLERTGLSIEDIDLFEVNEAFRLGRRCLVPGDGSRSRQGQRQWWRDCSRAPTWSIRSEAAHHPGS